MLKKTRDFSFEFLQASADLSRVFPENLSPPRAWAEVSSAALQHNYAVLQQAAGEAEVMAVVKANAYGHGVMRVFRALERFEPRFYGVANVMEARELAPHVTPERLYLLGAASPAEYHEIVECGYVPCVSSLGEAAALNEVASRIGKSLAVHIALDTGMGRGGFLPESDALAVLATLSLSHLRLEGMGTHLSVADEDEQFTAEQFTAFHRALSRFPPVRYRHIANSAGTIHFERGEANLVRPGLALYGISPLPDYQKQLRPALTLKSRISIIRELPAGCSISYGRTYQTTRTTKVATIGIGYGDGYQRALSGTGVEVLICGVRCRVLGRVTMDQIMADVTDCPGAEPGSEVELFGENMLVGEIAQKAGTIPWELLTAIAPRVVRHDLNS